MCVHVHRWPLSLPRMPPLERFPAYAGIEGSPAYAGIEEAACGWLLSRVRTDPSWDVGSANVG
jgi:hypothetical protein